MNSVYESHSVDLMSYLHYLDSSFQISSANSQSFTQRFQSPTMPDENGRQLCLACAEGLYCSVAAALHQQQQPSNVFYYSNSCPPPPPKLIFNHEQEWDNTAASHSESDAFDSSPKMLSLSVPSMSSAKAHSNHDFGQSFAEIFVKHESSDHEMDLNAFHRKIVPTLDENGNRKRYSRFRSKNHVCDFCNKSFTLKQNVQTHMSLYHMSSQPVQRSLERRFQCNFCSEIFKTAKAAMLHKRKVHVQGEVKEVRPPTSCEYCTRIFGSVSAMKDHVRSFHNGERPFACDRCDAKFGRRNGLHRHVKMVHEGILHYCSVPGCDHSGFKCSKALAAHVLGVHEKIKPYRREMCNRCFVRKSDLNFHLKTHRSI